MKINFVESKNIGLAINQHNAKEIHHLAVGQILGISTEVILLTISEGIRFQEFKCLPTTYLHDGWQNYKKGVPSSLGIRKHLICALILIKQPLLVSTSQSIISGGSIATSATPLRQPKEGLYGLSFVMLAPLWVQL